MKKFFTIFLLLAFIAVSGLYIILRVGFLGADDNYINLNFRQTAARYSFLRNVFALRYDGDARADYLGKKYNKIQIEADAMQGVKIDYSVLDRLAKKISEITGKPVSYYISEENIPYVSEVQDEDITAIVNNYRNSYSESGTATLYLLYAGSFKGDSKQIGLTYQESGLVVFADALGEFTKNSSLILPHYTYSTLLHEFGHQLGLGHNEQEGCLMTAKAESNDQAVWDPALIVTDFCEYEKSLLLEAQENI